jgi:hypothetical protein
MCAKEKAGNCGNRYEKRFLKIAGIASQPFNQASGKNFLAKCV